MRDRSAGAQRARRLFDVLAARPRERRDDRPPHAGGNLPHGFRVGRRRDGEPRLDDVHAERVERPRHRQLGRARPASSPGACSPSRRVVSKMVTRAVVLMASMVGCGPVEVKAIMINEK